MRGNVANTSLWSLTNENIIHFFLWFYAWIWSISREENETDKRCGWHCCFDVTNNCIYGGIIQFIYFPLIVPIKRWHFPSICSLLMFYVLLFSRVCVLLSKRANFSQCSGGREVGSQSLCCSVAVFLLVPTKGECCSLSLKGNVTPLHRWQRLTLFRVPTTSPGPGICSYSFQLPSWQAYEADTQIVPIWGIKGLRFLGRKYTRDTRSDPGLWSIKVNA